MAKILLSIFTGQSSPSSVAAYPNPNLVTVDDKLLVRGGVSSTHGDERVITLDEVALHDTPSDCWIIIYDRVYDITDFTDEVCVLHPFNQLLLTICVCFSIQAVVISCWSTPVAMLALHFADPGTVRRRYGHWHGLWSGNCQCTNGFSGKPEDFDLVTYRINNNKVPCLS